MVGLFGQNLKIFQNQRKILVNMYAVSLNLYQAGLKNSSDKLLKILNDGKHVVGYIMKQYVFRNDFYLIQT